MKQNKSTVAPEIALQIWLRPEITPVGPDKDYADFRGQLDAVDRMLANSHLESMAMDFARQGWSGDNVEQLRRHVRFGLKALRVEILRMILGNISFRKLSVAIASSELLADFCGARRVDGIVGVSKSVLERASKFYTAGQVRWMGQVFIEMCGETDRAAALGLAEAQPMETCLVDSTCLEANIWLFIGHPDAGRRSAIIYSLVVSCLRHRKDPLAYLRDLLTRLPRMTNRDALAPLTPALWLPPVEVALVAPAS